MSFKAKPAETVTYKVEHWQQNVTGNDYTKKEEETKTGKPDENTQAAAKTYEGFTAKAVTQVKIKADGSTVVKIEYDRKEISLTLDLKGGSTTTSFTDGNKLKGRFDAPVSVANPTKEGYTFSVWNPELPAKFPAEDKTYTAQWEKNKYTVTFDAKDGSPTPAAQTVPYKEKASAPSPVPAKEGHTLEGWYNKEGNTPWDFAVNEVTKNTELYAQWTPLYTITFGVEGSGGTLKAADGETEINSGNTVEEGKTITFTATPDPGYEVKAWTKNGDPIAAAGTNSAYTHTVQADTDIKAAFKPSDKIYTVNGVNFTMKGIAAVTGKSVGHPDIMGYTGANDNEPHSISLSAYRIGETEVTQELWQAVMGNNPSWFKHSPESGEEQGKRPVENINWYEAIAFCNKLSIACGLEPCYTVTGVNFGTLQPGNIPIWDDNNWNNAVCDLHKNGFRLPTEAEWEWAAMGGTEDKWAGTNDKSELGNYAWYESNSNDKTHQVKMKSANGYGLYDMSGNVFEWCWDWYGSLSDALPPDYTGAASGRTRVERGGSWNASESYAPRAYRAHDTPVMYLRVLGLRVVSRP